MNLCTLGNSALYSENRTFCYVDENNFVIYNYEALRKYILYWGLRQTSDCKAGPKNDGHLGYTDTLNFTWNNKIN